MRKVAPGSPGLKEKKSFSSSIYRMSSGKFFQLILKDFHDYLLTRSLWIGMGSWDQVLISADMQCPKPVIACPTVLDGGRAAQQRKVGAATRIRVIRRHVGSYGRRRGWDDLREQH